MTQATPSSDNIHALSDEEVKQLVTSLESQETRTHEEVEEVTVPDTTTQEETTEEPIKTEEAVPNEEVAQGIDTSTTETAQETEIDYKAFYESVTRPITANGKEIQVTSPEDMIRLMQQGAGFHKKMAALKPVTKVGKLLEEHGLMDETKLNYLIDLHNKNPEAIAKLVKESGIDLYEFDVNKGDSYQPQIRQVAESSISLQTVLEDLKENSPTYERTITILGNGWDEQSRETLAQYPSLISIIDSQVQDGTYDKIQSVIEYERIMGRLVGVSDLMAYKQVGEQLFGSAQNNVQPQQQAATPSPVVVPHVTETIDPAIQQRKKAAGIPKTNPVSTTTNKVNPHTLSDEEVIKRVQELLK